MKIRVYYGKQCPRCPAAKKVCKEVAEEKNIEYEEVDIEEHMIEALQKQIAATPSILLDDEVIFRGEIPTKEQLEKEVDKR